MSSVETPKVHKLQNTWIIYEQIQFYQEKDKASGYKNSYDGICLFKTVEGFWMNWNRIPTVTQLFFDGETRTIKRVDENKENSKVKDIKIEGQSIFKQGIAPEWEDPENAQGGDMRVNLDVSAHDSLGQFWEKIVLSMIGETLDESDDICGARILDKSKPKTGIAYRLEIWFKTWSDEELKSRLENKLQQILSEFNFKAKIAFTKHDKNRWA